MDRLKKLGDLLGTEPPRSQTPPEGATERRAGRRISLPLEVRLTLDDGSTQEGKIGDVNLAGLSIAPPGSAQVGTRMSIGFRGYPGVCGTFVLVGTVRRLLMDEESQTPVALGIAIDRQTTTPEGMQSYRTLVRHYLHHRPLLEDVNKGYFEGKCPSCGWLGRVGRRNPLCSRCGTRIEPVQDEDA